ncbi:MAG TPA: glycosyltransferase [Bryobacteraceae bacterium]|nr:glycosyltransferase [Bryobacteraceae bacterium]
MRVRDIAIILPVYNDWAAVRQLLPQIDQALGLVPCRARLLLVNDASDAEPNAAWPRAFRNIEEVSTLHLRRNLGHQRAIAVGLAHIYHNWRGFEALIVMDADGEDRPEHLGALLAKFQAEDGAKVIFAARSKRLESPAFRFFYHAYRILHKALTGIAVRVGNFSVLPPRALRTLMAAPELWNHYAAAVYRARIPHASIFLPRGSRLAGQSKMNFVSLLAHGLSAISIFAEVVAARLLAFTAAAILLIGASAGAFLFVRFTVPAWIVYSGAIFLIVLVQTLMVSLALAFIIASGRTAAGFLPLRDALFFVDRVEQVIPAKSTHAHG